MKKIFIAFLFIYYCASYISFVYAQECMGWHNPTNFTNTGVAATWSGYIGTKNSVSSTCTTFGCLNTTAISAENLATTSGGSSCYNTNQTDYQKRFVIKTAGTAQETGNALSFLPPDSNFNTSIRIGNYCGGTQWEALQYEFTVSMDNALFTIWYAMSVYNALHTTAYNPEFVIHFEVLNPITNGWDYINDSLCLVQYTPVSGSSSADMGFVTSSSGGHSNIYKPWSKLVYNLWSYLYRTIRVTMASSDCAYSAHYGTAYIAGDCEPPVLRIDTASNEIYAPQAVESCSWYRSLYGELNDTDRYDMSNYELISDTIGDTLPIRSQYFSRLDGISDSSVTIMCQFPATYPMTNRLYITVVNTVLDTDMVEDWPVITGLMFSVDSSHILISWDEVVDAMQYEVKVQHGDDSMIFTTDRCSMMIDIPSNSGSYNLSVRYLKRHQCWLHDTTYWSSWCNPSVFAVDSIEIPLSPQMEIICGLQGDALLAWSVVDGAYQYDVKMGYAGSSLNTFVVYHSQEPQIRIGGLSEGVDYEVYLSSQQHHHCWLHDTVIFSDWSGPFLFNLANNPVSDLLIQYQYIHDTVYADTLVLNTPVLQHITVGPFDMQQGIGAGNGDFPYGTTVEIAAVPIEGYRFNCRNDGDINNPRQVTLYSDTAFTATFTTIGIDVANNDEYNVYVSNREIVVDNPNGNRIRVFDAMGRIVCSMDAVFNTYRYQVHVPGVYLVQVGSGPARKVAVVW